ncbi:hypothetical protein BH11PSE8_BH11PSE8_28890 [soil metagenome]
MKSEQHHQQPSVIGWESEPKAERPSALEPSTYRDTAPRQRGGTNITLIITIAIVGLSVAAVFALAYLLKR